MNRVYIHEGGNTPQRSQLVDNQDERRVGFELKLNAEAKAVLNSSVFTRSPVLSKLLRYLVDQTVDGRGDALKSYAVAVDGLGRPETFDAASDSSARVQMVRLRHALESHYAHHGPVEDQCLFLQPGSYRVRLAKLAVAYPLLYRPLSQTDDRPLQIPAPSETSLLLDAPVQNIPLVAVNSREPRFRIERRHRFLGFGVAAGIIVALLAWFGWQQLFGPSAATISPVLEILPMEDADTSELSRTSRLISSTFATDLPRFKVSRVRILGSGDEPGQPGPDEELYRLASRIDEDVSGGQRLYLRLTDARTGTAFWSDELQLETDVKTVPDALVPLIANINGPFGAIASHSLITYGDGDNAGYACLLKYYSFVQTRAVEIESKIAACLKKPVKEQRLRAPILAARALFNIERMSAMKNFDAAADTSITFARAAVAADPNDAMANFAMARLSYLKNDCVSARFYTGRAIDANANSPLILANLAALSPMCNYPEARKLLDRAFLAQSELYPRGRLLLVLAALEQGRPEKIALIKPSDIPQSEFSRINYYLAETLIAGSRGQRELTARSWKRFVAAQPLKSRDPDVLLGQIIIMPKLRRKLLKILEGAGAFER